jgi:DNA-3-methyladenine glycosylase II
MTPRCPAETRKIPLRDRVNVRRSLEFYRKYGDDRINRFDGETYRRVIGLEDGYRLLCLRTASGLASSVSVSLWPPAGREQWEKLEHSTAFFMSHDRAAWALLLDADPRLRVIAARTDGHRTLLIPDVLQALVRSITAQQVSVAAAVAVRGRIAVRFGEAVTGRDGADCAYVLSARRLAAADIAEFRACGLSERKAVALREVAETVMRGGLDLSVLQGKTDSEVTDALCACRGIGGWSAQWFLARTLNRPVVVSTDLVVRKSVGAVYGGGTTPSPAEVTDFTAHWGPCAGTAQQAVLDHHQYQLTGSG